MYAYFTLMSCGLSHLCYESTASQYDIKAEMWTDKLCLLSSFSRQLKAKLIDLLFVL